MISAFWGRAIPIFSNLHQSGSSIRTDQKVSTEERKNLLNNAIHFGQTHLVRANAELDFSTVFIVFMLKMWRDADIGIKLKRM